MNAGFWIGIVGGAVVGLVVAGLAGTVIGAVIGMVFWGRSEAQRWEQAYWELRRKKGQAVLEITLREPSGKVVALHNLVALPPDTILQALRLVALGREFTVRQMSPTLTEDQFNALRDELVERGYMVHRGARRAAEWTPQGEALVAEVKAECLSLSGGRVAGSEADRQRVGEGRMGIAAWERELAIGDERGGGHAMG